MNADAPLDLDLDLIGEPSDMAISAIVDLLIEAEPAIGLRQITRSPRFRRLPQRNRSGKQNRSTP